MPDAERGLSDAEMRIMRSVEDEHWWYQALRGHVLACLESAAPEVRETILDAGCGSGGMLARLQEKFPHASLTGVDISEEGLRLTSHRQTGAQLVRASVDQLTFPDSAFDVVISLDVLYHRDVDDRVAIQEMARVLRRNGRLLMNLPAFDFLRGSHDVAINTARRYTRSQVVRLLQEAGLRLDRITYWNMLLLPAVALVRRSSRSRTQVRSDLTPPSVFTNSILSAIARSELALSHNLSLPFGTSVFAIARK